MTHLTLTGPFCRVSICGRDRIEAFGSGESFMHAVHLSDVNDPKICPKCLKTWIDIDEGTCDQLDELL